MHTITQAIAVHVARQLTVYLGKRDFYDNGVAADPIGEVVVFQLYDPFCCGGLCTASPPIFIPANYALQCCTEWLVLTWSALTYCRWYGHPQEGIFAGPQGLCATHLHLPVRLEPLVERTLYSGQSPNGGKHYYPTPFRQLAHCTERLHRYGATNLELLGMDMSQRLYK